MIVECTDFVLLSFCKSCLAVFVCLCISKMLFVSKENCHNKFINKYLLVHES
jgi:hypothetical protein